MLIVDVTLHSAITNEKSNIGRILIYNDGTGDSSRGNYVVEAGRSGQDPRSIHKKPLRKARIENHARLSKPVWNLVKKALEAIKY